jgi:hypothetical protein
MKCCTQAGPGVVDSLVNEREEFMTGNESFQKPSTSDIFPCNGGPFTAGPSLERNTMDWLDIDTRSRCYLGKAVHSCTVRMGTDYTTKG